MKKLFLLPLLALLLGACSSDSDGVSPEGSNGDEIVRSYLSVAIYTPSSLTRADDSSDYENGNESENKINKIRFFFFKTSGDPCLVFKGTGEGNASSYLSYIDWAPEDGDVSNGDGTGTVEKIATATLGLNQPEDEPRPSLVLAVINPTQDVLSLQNPQLDQLRGINGLENNYLNNLTSGNFLITNSVYVDENKDLITATPISPSNFGTSEKDNNMTPLSIYVERVLARLDFSLELDETTNPSKTITSADGKSYVIYQVSDPSINKNPDEENNAGSVTPVYVRLLGWNVTATAATSRAVKLINSNWNNDIFGNPEPWNIWQYHRSFWAINPSGLKYNYGSFNSSSNEVENVNPTLKNPIPENNSVETVYLQENAADYTSVLGASGPDTPTKLIIGAQLVNETGEPIALARWANKYYTEEGLLKAVANVLNLYQKTENGTFLRITDQYLECVKKLDGVDDSNAEGKAQYNSYVQLNNEGKAITWYDGSEVDATPFTDPKGVNEYIFNRVNYVMVWKSGNTYYYFDIRHLGAEGSSGAYGIVRNHLYKTILTSIMGLGTPVFDPDEVIYPERPNDDNTLSFEVKVLQWRIVQNKYSIEWP